MLGSIWNFVKRHKKKFIFSGVVVGGTWMMYKYLLKRLKEIREEEDKEYINVVRRQHHFDSNQRTCNMTVLSMIPNIREILINKLNTEEYTTQLKQSPANKLELWATLKVCSFSRTIASVYGCCLMSVILRVQLNVMGGYIFLDNSQDSKNGYIGRKHRTTKAVQERYLSLIKHFVGPGLVDLIEFVKTATAKELDSLSLRDQLSLENMQSLIQHIRDRVEQRNGLPSTLPLSSYLMPNEQKPDIEMIDKEEEIYDKLIQETRDVIDSPDFQTVITVCLDKGFSKLMDYIAEHYKNISNKQTDIHDCGIPLAKMVPVVNGLVFKIVADAPNVFIQELLLMEEVKKFAGNIYEAFSQRESS
ncbi:hypothetical protein SNE40_012470 [Patella caerulea]|uniref:Peroxisomal biogenesis factor 3 n=1 Tax=Patella caerulea TaxID=87958 RepID=A0AAN8PNA6_PATCE